ncbi:neuropeptide receptor 22-like [Montipora capricornis]|uniref:neuropeptide receptor 22-like n=1 Tax=Montipora capricornis TaxID=246305 RepID=UPI0035F0FCD6
MLKEKSTMEDVSGTANSAPTSIAYTVYSLSIESSANITNNASLWLQNDIDKLATGFKLTGFLLLFLVSLSGNALLVAVLLENANHRMRTPSNYFIFSMACGDIILTVYCMPQFAITTAYHYRWLVSGVAGLALCRLSVFLGQLSVLVSTASLFAIALDRLFLVFYPLKRKITLTKAKYAIVANWLLSIVFSLPPLPGAKVFEIEPGYIVCALDFELWDFIVVYLLFCFSIVFVFPLMAIAIYIAIAIKLNRTKRPGNQLPSNRERREQMNHKILTMLVAVVVALIVCRLPLIIVILSCMFGSIEICGQHNFVFAGWFLTYANSGINPWIYFIFNEQFRQGAKLVLKKVFPCCCKSVNVIEAVESNGVDMSTHLPRQ